MSIEPENIIVTEDVQENYIIYDRVLNENLIPEFDENILVTNDHLSNRLFINVYYKFDDRDLSNKNIYIKWINADNKSGISECVDKKLVNDRLSFAWNVPIEATYKAGTLNFSIQITSPDYVWNSLSTSVEVRQGLITESFNNLEEEEAKPEWDEYIEDEYKTVCKVMTAEEYQTLPDKSEDILYIVQDEDDACVYLGDLPVNNGDNDLMPYEETTADDYIYITVNSSISGNPSAMHVEIIYYKGTSRKPIVPRTIGGYPVTVIHATAFNNPKLIGVELPDTLLYIA